MNNVDLVMLVAYGLVLFFFVGSGFITGFIAHKFNRNPIIWFIIGSIMPLISMVVLVLLPEKFKKKVY